MLGGVFVVFGYCLRRAGPSQSAGSSDPGHSQASRPRPALLGRCPAATARRLHLAPQTGILANFGLMMN